MEKYNITQAVEWALINHPNKVEEYCQFLQMKNDLLSKVDTICKGHKDDGTIKDFLQTQINKPEYTAEEKSNGITSLGSGIICPTYFDQNRIVNSDDYLSILNNEPFLKSVYFSLLKVGKDRSSGKGELCFILFTKNGKKIIGEGHIGDISTSCDKGERFLEIKGDSGCVGPYDEQEGLDKLVLSIVNEKCLKFLEKERQDLVNDYVRLKLHPDNFVNKHYETETEAKGSKFRPTNSINLWSKNSGQVLALRHMPENDAINIIKEDILKKYFPFLEENECSSYAEEIYKNIGTEKAKIPFLKINYKHRQKEAKWDALVLVNTETGKMIVIKDIDDDTFLKRIYPLHMMLTVHLRKTKSNNQEKLGHVTMGIKGKEYNKKRRKY